MTTPTPTKLLTADEFDLLPERPSEEGGKYELVDGVVIVMAPVGVEHGEEQITIGAALRAFARRQERWCQTRKVMARSRSRAPILSGNSRA